MVGCGLLSILRPGQKARSVCFQLLLGAPVGVLRATAYFPVLAPLPVQSNASALALVAFVRSLGTVRNVPGFLESYLASYVRRCTESRLAVWSFRISFCGISHRHSAPHSHRVLLSHTPSSPPLRPYPSRCEARYRARFRGALTGSTKC
jgi:hypothetical protein